MGFPGPAGYLKLRGRLIADPATLDFKADPDYGGTVLGAFDQIAWVLEAASRPARAQEFGGVEYEDYENAIGYRVVARLRSWEEAALSRIFPSVMVTEGATTQQPVLTVRVTDFLTRRATDRAFVLLYAPDAPETDPSIIAYACTPRVRQVANVQLNLGEGWGFPAIFRALPTTDGVIMRKGRVRDLSLTP